MGDVSMDDVLHAAYHDLACPACGREFEPSELRLRGALEKQYLVQASCQRGHSPALVLYIVTKNRLRAMTDDRLTADNVLDLHNALKAFDGNFKKVFQEPDEQPKS
ncbi:hypothetical protein HY375_01065 [Candidatus Berkelbacteria bacterium]|nr:hypothetical protein [Candidatus Berkelbacteria bacterium]